MQCEKQAIQGESNDVYQTDGYYTVGCRGFVIGLLPSLVYVCNIADRLENACLRFADGKNYWGQETLKPSEGSG